MDSVSSLEWLKLDSQSEEPDKDGGGKDLFSPATIPLNCNTPIIGSKSDELESKESETEESEDEGCFIGECKYCLKVNKHPTNQCSYEYKVPKDAIVGESCVVACLVCGCLFRDSRCADCGTSLGRAFLKDCSICGKEGEHLEFECPERDANCGFTYDPYTGSFSVEIRPLKEYRTET
ncbi:uncharacterized protein Pyn_39452 [Prunus yedoensis var. nudiflora]|uniref:Uncharacterized protein n=1 Tax=Prunus yedoensis var. nudiflora TaxID=2094558 RepID=A0A314Z9I0_PRUYE|nr:uncharacterized protein Pyn_39452 [Prunus yedoensis var. nudiflora]